MNVWSRLPGKCEGDTACEHANYIADMPLWFEKNRIPRPAQNQIKHLRVDFLTGGASNWCLFLRVQFTLRVFLLISIFLLLYWELKTFTSETKICAHGSIDARGDQA